MKNKILCCLIICCSLSHITYSQNLPVRTATIFKNGQTLLAKSGKVAVKDNKYTVSILPDALFGTYWASSPTGELASVFSRQDTLRNTKVLGDNHSILMASVGKKLKVWVRGSPDGPASAATPVEGVLEQSVMTASGVPNLLFHTTDGRWLYLPAGQVQQIEFPERPNLPTQSVAAGTIRTLELNFKGNKTEQALDLLYLTNQLGWMPIYQLELNDAGKSRLSLRAEIANDAEDISGAELRLAVGVPNFTYATLNDWLNNFYNPWAAGQGADQNNRPFAAQSFAGNVAHYSDRDADTDVSNPGEGFEGNKAEDFYFYTVRPGNFPKFSRYQYPIFETEVEPTHFYECRLSAAGPMSFNTYYQPNSDPNDQQNPVSHYVEFKNATAFPWTTGVVNILSQQNGHSYPISQDKLGYTPSAVKCKVRVAQTPEIKVTHGEGDIERKENVRRFFSQTYDEITVEGEVCVVNHKDKPVTVKVLRSIEGAPVSSDRSWKTQQEQATLRVNSRFDVEWDLDLKAGEEQKWKYRYKVYVRL